MEGLGDKENPKATRNSKYGKSNSVRKNERNFSKYKIGTPAYKSTVLRERERELRSTGKKGVSSDQIVVLGDEEAILTGNAESTFNLKKEDLLRLQADYQWLNDSLVNAGQALICEKFPNVKGLQNINLSCIMLFKQESGEFIQVLNTANTHWVCASTIGCKPLVVNVYDSARTGDLSENTLNSIAAILRL